MLGNHGIWTKMVMHEDAIAIPMILSGEDFPGGQVIDEPTSPDASHSVMWLPQIKKACI